MMRHRGRSPKWLSDNFSRTPATLGSVTALALDGFVRNAFFLIVDGRQVTELDETIPFRPTSEVTFVRLVPLVGG